MSLARQLIIVTVALVLAFGWQLAQTSWVDLWLTPDQQGQRAYNSLEFQRAAELFQDATWSGIANYDAGQYEEAAALFSRSIVAESAFNRGNALMKARKYQQAIGAYEIAVNSQPQWQEATDNLELAIYVTDYIERVREQGDTGDESEISADGYVFDNRKNKGEEMTITNESVMEAASAEKWMRAVSTETSEYLQMRFTLEASKQSGGPASE